MYGLGCMLFHFSCCPFCSTAKICPNLRECRFGALATNWKYGWVKTVTLLFLRLTGPDAKYALKSKFLPELKTSYYIGTNEGWARVLLPLSDKF